MIDVRRAILLAERAKQRILGDPVKNFRFSSYAQRDFVKSLSVNDETALQASNFSGKTTIGSIAFVAMMRGIRELCGDIVGVEGIVEASAPVLLPLLATPVSFAALAQGHEMAKESIVKALNKAVGSHPHYWERTGNVIRALWVKPDDLKSDDWKDWSALRIFVEDGQSVAGMRLDGVWGDEPPDWDMWLEMRMRMEAGKLFIRALTYTPIKKSRWKPVVNDFKGCEGKPKDGKLLIRMSVYDNKRLTAADIRRAERAAQGPLRDAKLYGEPVDVDSSCPFEREHLKKWKARCIPPIRVEDFQLLSGHIAKVSVWEDQEPGEPYMVIADPSGGIEDEAKERDPAGFIVVGRRSRRVVVRFNGYVIAGELGRMASFYAARYNRALLCWERNSGYGEAFFQGIGNYGNVYVESHGDSRGLTLNDRLGWYTNATTRGTLIGALQRALATDGSIFVFSDEAVDSLGDVAVRRDGIRIEAGAGSHDEDMIILGIACHLLETYPAPPPMTPKGSDTLLKDLGLKRRLPMHADTDPFAFR